MKLFFKIAGGFTVLASLLSTPSFSASAPSGTQMQQITPVAPAGRIVSSEPYSARDVRVSRLDNSTNVLSLRFDNTNISAPENGRTRTENFTVAGAAGVLPSVTVKSAKFVQFAGEMAIKSDLQPPENLQANLARIADLGVFRQYHLYTLSLSFSSPGALGQQWVVEQLELEIDLGEPRTGGTTPAWFQPVVDPPGSHVVSHMLLNADIPRDFYVHNTEAAADTRSSWTTLLNSNAAGKRVARLDAYDEGIYYISKADLAAAGVNAATPATAWQVYRQGVEIPVIADTADAANGLYITVGPAEGTDPHQAYYLIIPDQVSAPAMRLATAAAPTSQNQDLTTAAFSISRIKYKDYHPKIRPQGIPGKWYWTEISPGRTSSLDYEMPEYFSGATASSVQFTVFYGFANFTQPTAVSLYLNGAYAGQTTATSQQGSAIFSVDPKMVRSGSNNLVLQLAKAGGPAMVVQNIDAAWSQALPPARKITGLFSTASSTVTRVLKFPAEVGSWHTVAAYKAGNWQLLPQTAGSHFSDAGSAQSYGVVSRSTAGRFAKVLAVDPIKIPSMEGADYVLISGAEMLTATEKLAAWHTARGVKAKAINVRDIFSAYAYGRRDPRAIRSFLRHAYYSQAGSGRLAYVALVGEASDYRFNPDLLPPGAMPDIIPTAMADNPDAMPGDHQYAASLGSDQMADFILGRIPVSTAAEMEGVVNKIKAYAELQPESWNGRTEFVLDDNEEFPVVADSIMKQSFAPPLAANLFRQWDYPYTINMRVNGMRRSHQGTAALINMFNSGVGFLNFFGHGGPNLWSHERLLHMSDMALMHNTDKLPMITCASCDSAWINYPMLPVKVSMGEAMVTKPDGGGIALFGPVAGASPFEHSILVERLMEGISRVGLRRTGDAVFYSKNQYFAESRSSAIPDQYLLLGDPAVSLNLPDVATGIKHGGRDLVAGKLSGMAMSVPFISGTATVRSLQTGDLIATAPIKAGRVSLQVKVEKPGSVSILAADEATTRVAGTEIRVLPNLESQGHIKPAIVKVSGAVKIAPATPFVSTDQLTSAENATFNFTATATTTMPLMVTARLYKKEAVIGESANVSLGRAGSVQMIGLSTREPLAGPIEELVLKLFPADSTTATLAELQFTVPVNPPADLAWIPGSASAESWGNQFLMRETVFLKGKLKNIGMSRAENIMVTAMQDNPTSGAELGTINGVSSEKIGDLDPGQSIDVNYRWEEANSPGTKTVFLVANKTATIKEQSLLNNHIAVPPFEISRIGNISIGPVSWSPKVARVGEKVSISATIFDDHPTSRGPLSYEIGFRNPLTRETTAVEEILPMVGAFTTVSKTLAMPEGFTQVYATGNSSRELEEVALGDSTSISPVMVVGSLAPNDDGTFSPDLNTGQLWNLATIGAQHLRMVDTPTSSSGMIPMGPELPVSPPASPRADKNDNLWCLSSWQLAAGPEETVGEITISIPLPGLQAGAPLEASILGIPSEAESSVDFDLKQPGDTAWQSLHLTERTPDNKVTGNIKGIIGSDNKVDLVLRQQPGKAVNIQAITFNVLAAEYETSAIELPAEWVGGNVLVNEFADSTGWQKMQLSFRQGTVGTAGGDVDWSEWSAVEGNSFKPNGRLIQFRCYGWATAGHTPYLQNLKLKVQ